MTASLPIDPALVSWLASMNKDPVRWVYGAFPWSEPDTALAAYSGPDAWQLEILCLIRDGLLTVDQAVKLAVASGHGIGKTALVSWIILWGFSTCPDCRGRVTAGTETQLRTVTWAELGKWYNLFIARSMFDLTATALLSVDPDRKHTWRIDLVPWSENNPQAFAGMHNKDRRIIYIFDEGSAISDIIYETAEGALTDKATEIIWCVFGNPTRNTGRFKELFPGGKYASGWTTRNIDSRTVAITNKRDIAAKIAVEGEDSDYIRIRVKGEFPRVGEMEFISVADVDAAMARDPEPIRTDPLALGVDVARYGQNESVLFFRKGRDARTIPFRTFRGLDTVSLAQHIYTAHAEYHTDGIFIDSDGVGGGVADNVRALHLYCFEVHSGTKPDGIGFSTGNTGELYANKRAEMWGAMRSWIKNGGCLPSDPELRQQLISPKYTLNLQGQIQLEKKSDMMRRGVESPDRADALAYTFAYALASHALAGGDYPHKPIVETEYNPYDHDRMAA